MNLELWSANCPVYFAYRGEDMRQTVKRNRMMAAVAAMLVAVGRAMAQNEEEATPEAPARRIVVSIPDRKLALIENGKVIKIYPTAVGADASPSPTGTFTVISRVPNPTWYHAGKVVPPGKNNPVGSRWIGLSEKGYGIHGTNAPKSIGHNVSHGCIRLLNRDIEQLFEMVKVGDVVELHGEITGEIARIFHPDAEIALAAGGGGAQ
jgi:lipoprotein-anchoring transpeptidase ErfK/SrfK